MPVLPVKERFGSDLRLRDLRDMSREDIVRTVSEFIPDVDLSKLERPKMDRPKIDFSKVEIPDSIGKFDWPNVDVGKAMSGAGKVVADAGKAVSDAASSVHVGRRKQRSRWPMAVGGLMVAGLVTWAVLANEAVRTRISDALTAVRDRVMSMVSKDDEYFDLGPDDAVAFDRAETAPLEEAPFSDTTDASPAPYPDGLGAERNGGPAFEEATVRD